MSTTLNVFKEPIVAIACRDMQDEFHFIYFEKPITLRDLDFQDELLRIDNVFIVFDWFNAVVVCTEETLREIKQELQYA